MENTIETQKSFSETVSPIKEIMDRLIDERIENAKLDLKLIEFELLYSVFISKKERKKTAQIIREFKDKTWAKAMRLARNNEDKAIDIYDELVTSF